MTTVEKSFKPLRRPGKNTPKSWKRLAVRLTRVLRTNDVAHIFNVDPCTVTGWTRKDMNGDL